MNSILEKNLIEGFWDVIPKIANVSFPIKGKMAIDLEDGRTIIVPLSKFPSIEKLTKNQRINWYQFGNGFTFDFCDEVIHIEQILGNFESYKHEKH